MSVEWTKFCAGSYKAETEDGKPLSVIRDGRVWYAFRDGRAVLNATDGIRFASMVAAKRAAPSAATEPEPVEPVAEPVETVERQPVETVERQPVRVSRQVRRAEARRERKAATRPGPFDGGRAARSLSAASAGERLEPVAWSTPVKPLTGSARHAVFAGTTPPEQIRAASFAYWRQAGMSARGALEAMREDCAAGRVRFPAFHPDANPDRAAFGEARVRWIENPEALGLRLVGLAHDCGNAGHAYSRDAVEHTGWFLDSDDCGETVAGVVYRLPGRDGRARYLAGYADPWQTDKAGKGPALLSLEIITGEPRDSDWDADPAEREAACTADGIAERMAEESRNWSDGESGGRAAREAATVALEDGRAMVAACRSLRSLIPARGGFPGFPGHMARQAVREALAALREARETYADSLRLARKARRDKPGAYDESRLDGWRSGYGEAV